MQTAKNTYFELFKYVLFFFYFSAVYQGLCYFTGASGSTGLRDSFFLSLLWIIPLLIFQHKAKIIAGLIGLVLLLTSLSSLGYFILYGQEFSQSVIFIIFESNISESQEFFHTYFQWWMVPIFIIYSLVPLLFWRVLKPIHITPKASVIISILIVISIGTSFVKKILVKGFTPSHATEKQFQKMQAAAPWNIILGYRSYKISLRIMEALLDKNNQLPPMKNLVDENKNSPTTFILLVGESTNAKRMSLYGYERETTPRLDAMKDDLVVFDNVYCSRPYTIESLQQVLSFADQNNPDMYLHKPNLINIMKQAGYTTYWITNQQTQSKRNTMLTTFSQMTDNPVYLNNNRQQNSNSFDEVVLKPLHKALKDKATKKFIVVHLLGTHARYDFRYPTGYSKFDNEKTQERLSSKESRRYNFYDNAVYYNDYVVTEIINSIKDLSEKSALLYFSDHGEEVYDSHDRQEISRNEGDPTTSMYTIPFLIYGNKTWRDASDMKTLQSYQKRAYSSSDLIFTYCDLAGISFDEFDNTKSIINSDYTLHPILIGDPSKKSKLRDLNKEPF